MSRRALVRLGRRLLGLGLAGWAVLGGCSREPPAEAEARPNVLLVSVDTWNRDTLRVYDEGASSLPHLDAFAFQAAVFRRAFAPASWTLPSHASLLTGRYPHRHGATHPEQALDATIPTLAGVLRREGWTTVAFTDGGFAGRTFGLGRGFERYDEAGTVEIPGLPRGGHRATHPAQDVFGRARAFLRSRGPGPDDPPFFLFAHTFALHHYFIPRATSAEATRRRELFGQCVGGRHRCGEQTWRRLRGRYAAALRRVDQAFGRLLETLDERGLAEETLVVVLSDHGEGFEPERGRIHHGGRLHADQLRIPLLVRGPGVQAGMVATPISLVDVMPTLLRRLGVAPPPGLDGRDMTPCLHGKPVVRNAPIHALDHAFIWQDGQRLLVQASESPYAIARVGPTYWFVVSRGEEIRRELYALEDRAQHHDLAPARPDLAKRLQRSLTGAFRSQAEPPRVEMPEHSRRRLEALGYLDAD